MERPFTATFFAELRRDIDDLDQAVHHGREGCDDDAAFRVFDQLLDVVLH
jgi:hypothetical protein